MAQEKREEIMPEWLRWAFLIAFGVLMFALAFIIDDLSKRKK